MLQNSLVRINQLPPEVLSTIFATITEHPSPLAPVWRASAGPAAWLVVLRVCRYWRTLALSTPRLWTYIRIASVRDDDPAGLARRSLTLSHAAPLSVHVHNPRAHRCSAVYNEMLGQMHRVRELYISGVQSPEDLADFTVLLAPMLGTFVVHLAPRLGHQTTIEHLEVRPHGDDDWHEYPEALLEDELPALFSSHTPRLAYLAIEKFRITPRDIGAFSHLRCLWLRPHTCTLPRDLTLLLDLLNTNPALEDLVIEGAELATPVPPNPHHVHAPVLSANEGTRRALSRSLRRVSLPRLRRVVFTESDAGFVALVLAHLALPAHTAMRLASRSTPRGNTPILPQNVSNLANVAGIRALALQLGGDIEPSICAVSRPSRDAPSGLGPRRRRDGEGLEVDSDDGRAVWISSMTHSDGWLVDRLCPSLPLAQIEELWLAGFDNRPPQQWHATFCALPALATLFFTGANWNAEDWLLALSMGTGATDKHGAEPEGGLRGRPCPGLRELRVRAPAVSLLGPLSLFVQDRARCGVPLQRMHVMFLPSERAEVVDRFTAHASELRRYVGEVVVEVVVVFPKMRLPAVCTEKGRECAYWPSWHDGASY